MRVAAFILSTSLLSGCVHPFIDFNGPSDPLISAQPFIGLEEYQDRAVLRELMNVDPVRTEWCAAFVNAILEIEGIPSLNDQDHHPPLLARSFLYWGEPVDREDIRRGDVVVFPRGNQGWQGHVGFYAGTYIDYEDHVQGKEYWVILGGNQSNEVRYDLYDPNRAIGIRRYPINTIVQSTQ